MRLIAGLLACTMLLGASLTAEARDKRPTYRKSWSDRSDSGHYRSSTIAPNGTCQRDTGRPLDSLNLNQLCDREEFWNRMNDRGGGAMH
jgi:hypothetical protein